MRTILIKASESRQLQRQIAGRRMTRAIAMRFVAGDTLDEGIEVSHRLARTGKTVTLDYLGESVTHEAEARAAAKAYLEAVARLEEEQLSSGVSLKPSQMGMVFSPALCTELLGGIADTASGRCDHITLDMEGSDVTEATIALVEQMHGDGYTYVGCAVQSYLHRTESDVKRLSALGASVRLCKGAYAEPADIAYQARDEVDASYSRCAEYLLAHGPYPRFATHDHRLIHFVTRTAARMHRPADDFEFQMLYGIRTTLQDELVSRGYRVRVYVPYGDQWYPYFMRRLAERPANLMFFLRQLVSR
ncbi:MAG: proline dehydrogenase [Nitriliruptorales bacterium]|nr:proline dehydrogenase [Nitriliruptorales bacterium]